MKKQIICFIVAVICSTHIQTTLFAAESDSTGEAVKIPAVIGCIPFTTQKRNVSHLLGAMKKDPNLLARAQEYIQRAREVALPDFPNVVAVAESRSTSKLVALYYTEYSLTVQSGYYKLRVGDEWCSVVNMRENTHLRPGHPLDVSYTFETPGSDKIMSFVDAASNVELDIVNYQNGTMNIGREKDELTLYSIISLK